MTTGLLCRRRNRQGVVLFMVVSIVLMISLLTYGFLISMQTQNLAAIASGDRLQARQSAFSAREIVCILLEGSLGERLACGGLNSNPGLFRRIQLENDELNDEAYFVGGFVASDRTATRFGVENQSAKIDLARILIHESVNPEWGRSCLLELPGMTETMADRILDWMDPDDDPREFGAESEFYMETIGRPPRNGIPLSLDELVAIPEITHELMFGAQSTEDGKRKSGFERNENQGNDASGGWSRYLTVRAAERNEDFDGNPRINLNDSDLLDLHTRLVESVDIEIANFVILARQYGLISDSEDRLSAAVQTVTTSSDLSIDFSLAPTFQFESRTDVWNARISIVEADIDEEDEAESQMIVESPWNGDSTTLDDRLEKFMDVTTTEKKAVIPGRVNVLLAPREVLMSIPGIDSDLAEQIISTRENGNSQSKTCFWLLSSGLITMEQMKQLDPWITNRGEVCRFVFGGWSDIRNAPIVFDTVVDATSGTARQIEATKLLETHLFSSRLLDGRNQKLR